MEVPQWNYMMPLLHGKAFVNSGRGDISAETIRLLLDAAMLAPSGSNLQPARFIIAQSPAAKETLGRYTPYKFIVKAAAIFVCCADLTAMTSIDRRIGELLQ